MVNMLCSEGADFIEVDKDGSNALQKYTERLAQLLEKYWDLADTARRAVSEKNMRKTCSNAVPDIDIGDYVLYAVIDQDTKLNYRWKGPAVVTDVL